LPKHATPIVGAIAWLAVGEQGASAAGHYAEVVAINPDGYWLLVSEMNDNWRGAGFGLVNYRYIHTSPNVWFLY
jgi:surface antigen